MKKLIIMSFALLVMGGCCDSHKKECAMNKQNVVVETLLTRRSVRAYTPEIVPKEIMDEIVKCGIYAPSGLNRQPWEIRIVNNQEMLDEITKLYLEDIAPDDPRNPAADPNFRNMFRNAPTVAFIAIQESFCSQADCGLLAGNMVNTAWAYGIGSCIQMGPVVFLKTEKAADFIAKLGFSEGYEIYMAIGFGYPDETPAVKPRDTSKVKYID